LKKSSSATDLVARGPGQDRTSSVAELLARFRASDSQSAWEEFLTEYSPLLYHAAQTFTQNREEAADCFVFICEYLAKSGFRRLLQFKPQGAASFPTWLRVVARNLCLDWRRKVYGRVRPFKCVQRLSAVEMDVYRCRYEHNLARAETLRHLQATWPGLDEQQLVEIEERLEDSLSSLQRWILSARNNPGAPPSSEGEDERQEPEIIDLSPSPETVVSQAEQRKQLRESLAALPGEDRLLVRLRFEDELSLDEISRATGQGDAQRVHRRLGAILEKLRFRMTGHVGAEKARTCP
jgi:RNA polymerase sigma factor (sigma-70 family)